MPDNANWLPLFPLNAVLFPDGMLSLKVFETRYIDMVRNCMRQTAPFGVVLIKSGHEVGAPAEPEAVGSLAHIVQWDAEQPGVLMLRAQGGQRFRIHETRLHTDRHLEGRIELIAPDIAAPLAEGHQPCAATLALVMHDLQEKGRAELGERFESPFPETPRLDDAGWVANRWSEILPIPLKARQKLLELTDPHNRLEIIYQYLRQHHII